MAPHERLRHFREAIAGYQGRQSVFAEALGLKQGTYSNLETGKRALMLDHLILLKEVFRISTDWLLTGAGHPVEVNPDQHRGKAPLTSRSSPPGAHLVPVVQQRAYAGESGGWADEEHLDEQEHVILPGLDPRKRWIGIRVYGDSMSPTISPGDIAVCCLIQRPEDIESNYIHAVLRRHDGVLLKRTVLHRNEEAQYLVLKSDNKQYATFSIPADEIEQIWRVDGIFTRNLSGPESYGTRLNQIESAIYTLQDSIDLIQKRLPTST